MAHDSAKGILGEMSVKGKWESQRSKPPALWQKALGWLCSSELESTSESDRVSKGSLRVDKEL